MKLTGLLFAIASGLLSFALVLDMLPVQSTVSMPAVLHCPNCPKFRTLCSCKDGVSLCREFEETP